MTAQTLYDKLWDSHVVCQDGATALIYIDRHYVHENSSPQAYEGLKLAGRRPWRSQSIVATADHNTPTIHWDRGIENSMSRMQVETLDENIREYGALAYFPFRDQQQGIVHVIGPESGGTLPGMSIVCGDSHTSTHGAFSCLAFGIGASQIEHVLATQCLMARKSKSVKLVVDGALRPGVTAKDIALTIVDKIGAGGGVGYAIEYAGSTIRALSMEGRMTICNMAIEAGARTGLVEVDDTTIQYLEGRPLAPKGVLWNKAVDYWRTLRSDADAEFDKVVTLDATALKPLVTWGTTPEMITTIDGKVPDPEGESDPVKREDMKRALMYMGLAPNTPIVDIKIDKVFIGSCTNSRIEDLRAVAEVVRGKKIANHVKLAMVVPGSGQVRLQAEKEGIAKTLIDAGFEWRQPGCSMCLALNGDKLSPGERCASTSNRNFEGRQGAGGRTHLVSPAMAAAAAVAGHFVDISGQ